MCILKVTFKKCFAVLLIFLAMIITQKILFCLMKFVTLPFICTAKYVLDKMLSNSSSVTEKIYEVLVTLYLQCSLLYNASIYGEAFLCTL